MSEKILFSSLGESGILTCDISNITPIDGILKSYVMELPTFEKGVINKSNISGYCSGYTTRATSFKNFRKFKKLSYKTIKDKRFVNAFNLSYYLLLELKDGCYLAVLPLVSEDVMSFISLYNGVPRLQVSTFGTNVFSGSAPLFSWAFAEDPYSATQKCWELALQSDYCKDNIQLRSLKTYPELFDYLGWCSWEHYETNINEKNLSESIEILKKSPVPVRYVIVDDGYVDAKIPAEGAKSHLLSFDVNEKFPNGWEHITSLKEESSVKWVGIWRNMNGYLGGVSPEHTMTDLKDNLMPQTVHRSEGPRNKTETEHTMIVKPDVESSEKFYKQMVDKSIDGGFDFMKVDFQTYNFWMYSGTGNAVNSAHQNNQALEEATKSNNLPLLNCISQSSVNVFNTKHSIISRASVDLKLYNNNMAPTRQSFANNMWWGDILIGDLDEYHTSNEKTAQYLTIARAVSGGPVYISDNPEHINEEIIRPLIFNDGKIIRALAPAVPLKESLFYDSFLGIVGLKKKSYRVIAPGRHGSAVIAAFNFSIFRKVNGFINEDDYPFAAAKEQPYNGLWKIPKEGLVIYDYEADICELLDHDYTFTVDKMKAKIFNLAPIINGWAVIGRNDKYFGGCTYHIVDSSVDSIELLLDESGPITIYSVKGKPKPEQGILTDLGNGFYNIDLTIGEMNKKIIVHR